MVDVSLHVTTPAEMQALGKSLGAAASAGDRFLLEGPFGAGKTTFIQGLAMGLGVITPVSSPSFVIENQYRGRLTLYHIDLYRLERVDAELGESLGEHLFGEGVSAVEWAERLPHQLREGATLLEIALEGDGRCVNLTSPEQRLRSAVILA